QKFASVPGIVARARSRKKLLDKEAEFLRGFLLQTISEKTFRVWLSSFGFSVRFFYEDDWSEGENHRKFQLYALACFLDFFRPGEIDWRNPNLNDMQHVAKLLKLFTNSTERDKQTKLLRGLFDLKEDLKNVVVATASVLSREDRKILLECRDLRL